MRSIVKATFCLTSLIGVEAASIRRASNGVATVDLSKTTGPAQLSASGWLYGFPDNGAEADNSIPENFIRDVKFIANRAGGAQTQSRGWVGGYEGYVPRLTSTISNYHTTRKYNGSFILLVHDLWGADGGSIPLFPGDNGNWTEVDTFLQQLVDDLRTNDMLEGLVLDLWNEPDLTIFWDRPWDQYLAYYVHAHNFFRLVRSNLLQYYIRCADHLQSNREQLPDTLISGPSMAVSPSLNNRDWITWLDTIASNNAIPHIYSWHQIGAGSRQPDTTIPEFNTLKAVHSLPDRPIDINEYAALDEQNPACSVYYIAQLERHNLRGLRANWGMTTALHDFLANLIYKNEDGVYRPNGEWQLYKYYAAMEGDRVATLASSDLRFDVYATKSQNAAKIIAGTRDVQATYEISISGLTSLGLPETGSVDVRVYRFDWAGPAGEVGEPVNLGVTAFSYEAGTVSQSFHSVSWK